MKNKYESLKSEDLFQIHKSKGEINFVFPFNRELSFEQKEALIDKYYEEEPQRLFGAWISDSRNKDWNGDIEEKKKELFKEKLSQMSNSSLVMLQVDYSKDLE